MEQFREPAVIGAYYPADKDRLEKEIIGCFQSDLGPGKLPGKIDDRRKIKAAIVPHSNYLYSGSCAAHAYKKLSEADWPDTIIILGVEHKGIGKNACIWPDEQWKTPFGFVQIDKALSEKFSEPNFVIDKAPHLGEHSIEVQLPFLQYIYKDHKFKILPISVSGPLSQETAEQIASQIANVVKNEKDKKILLLVSSDLVHYGVEFNYFPFEGDAKDAKKKLAVIEFTAIQLIESLDLAGFIEYVKENNLTICGALPIAVAIAYSKELKSKKGKLLKYYTSSEITGNLSSSVSYASFVFE